MPRIQQDCTHSLEIKKSRFITYLHRTSQEQDAREFIKKIKKEHPTARHYCTAMIIGHIVRSNDDGEPAGTAGHPMLDVLMHEKMEDILVVVVRYFGGIKLGTGGLVRAYSNSVQEALRHAVLTQTTTVQIYEIMFPYDLIGKLDAFFRMQNIEIIDKDYGEFVTYQYAVPSDITNAIQEVTNGTIYPKRLQDKSIELPIERT
ncbi:MAG: YigZ family protein [Erysipelotrichaceae bacterium]|nr:YigZ family protein [Erysipelotrichaceae bacterium]